MEVALNLPELPKDSYDMQIALPTQTESLYKAEVCYKPFLLK